MSRTAKHKTSLNQLCLVMSSRRCSRSSHSRTSWRRLHEQRARVEETSSAAPMVAAAAQYKANKLNATTAAAAMAASPRLPRRLDALRHSRATDPTIRETARPIRVELLEKTPATALAAAKMLAENGFAVCRGDLSPQAVENARAEARRLYATKGTFKAGGFTAGGRDVSGTGQMPRGDYVLWMHERLRKFGGDAQAAGCPTLAAIDQLIANFGSRTIAMLSQLGADSPVAAPYACFDDDQPLHCCGRSDCMVACYPGGRAAYGRHIDSVDGDGREAKDFGRCFTVCYYLNEDDWDASRDGGALRLYHPPRFEQGVLGGGSEAASAARPNVAVDVRPTANTFVIFRADRIVHEVRPANRERLAASVWFYGGTRRAAQAALERGEIQG